MKKGSLIFMILMTIQFISMPLCGQTDENPSQKTSSPSETTSTKKVDPPDEMPRFPGCEDMDGTIQEKENCGKNKMLQYVYKNLNYPKQARSNGTEGMVVAQFKISPEGKVKNINIKRGIGDGCNDAVIDVITKMQQEITWIPGKKDEKAVEVQYTIPIKFKLPKKRKR
ncbi:MAG: energy transducer TonB [Saprospiraceae bacterium]|nr:energy transducer TonB [Saprospiraceae bacterium]